MTARPRPWMQAHDARADRRRRDIRYRAALVRDAIVGTLAAFAFLVALLIVGGGTT